MELETGNDRQYMEMVVRQSIVLHGAWQRELTWRICLHFDSLVLRLPYLFFGYCACAGSWNNDDSDLTSSREAPPALNVQNHDGRTFPLGAILRLLLSAKLAIYSQLCLTSH